MIARTMALMIGTSAASLGAFGAYQLQASIDGPTSYLAIAAPVVATSAAVIPYLAEAAWKSRQHARSLALWAVLAPAAAVMFYGAAERVHAAKAIGAAERAAVSATVTRAELEVSEARGAVARAIAAADKVRGAAKCDSRCSSIRASEDAARARLAQADTALRKVQGEATAASPLAVPVWLLPAALDLVAFVTIWAGLPNGGSVPDEPAKRKPAARRKNPKAKIVGASKVQRVNTAWRANLAKAYG